MPPCTPHPAEDILHTSTVAFASRLQGGIPITADSLFPFAQVSPRPASAQEVIRPVGNTSEVTSGLFHSQEEAVAVAGHDKAGNDGLTHDVDGVLDADALATRIVARFTVVSDPHGGFELAAIALTT